jgi:hypothetical protein
LKTDSNILASSKKEKVPEMSMSKWLHDPYLSRQNSEVVNKVATKINKSNSPKEIQRIVKSKKWYNKPKFYNSKMSSCSGIKHQVACNLFAVKGNKIKSAPQK